MEFAKLKKDFARLKMEFAKDLGTKQSLQSSKSYETASKTVGKFKNVLKMHSWVEIRVCNVRMLMTKLL